MAECKQSIVLIGMPGVGKTTIGKILAEDLATPFLDTDEFIQRHEQKSLKQIIEGKGVTGFREIEEFYILKLSSQGKIISTGGSVVFSQKAMAHLRNFCISVFLDATLDTLKERLGDLDKRGVIRSPGQSLDMIWHERYPLYEMHADIHVDTCHMTIHQVKDAIKKEVDLLKKKS